MLAGCRSDNLSIWIFARNDGFSWQEERVPSSIAVRELQRLVSIIEMEMDH